MQTWGIFGCREGIPWITCEWFGGNLWITCWWGEDICGIGILIDSLGARVCRWMTWGRQRHDSLNESFAGLKKRVVIGWGSDGWFVCCNSGKCDASAVEHSVDGVDNGINGGGGADGRGSGLALDTGLTVGSVVFLTGEGIGDEFSADLSSFSAIN